jgi:hypothetical protein
MAGTTLYTVSRLLSDWERRGAVSTGRQRIVIRSSDILKGIAEDSPP